jgi:hypothetical protein
MQTGINREIVRLYNRILEALRGRNSVIDIDTSIAQAAMKLMYNIEHLTHPTEDVLNLDFEKLREENECRFLKESSLLMDEVFERGEHHINNMGCLQMNDKYTKYDLEIQNTHMAINDCIETCIQIMGTFQDKNKKTDIAQPQQITLPCNLLLALQKKGYIEDKEAKPLKWTKTNSLTHGKTLNKKSLLDLLCLLKYPDSVIKDRKLLNSVFIFPNDQKLKPQNYTGITDSSKERNIIRPIISEYHTELENVISSLNQTGKEK